MMNDKPCYKYVFVVGFDKDVHDSELALYSFVNNNVSIIDNSKIAMMPSSCSFDCRNKLLYVTDEMNNMQGKIVVYDLSNNSLKCVQLYNTHGSNPCYIELDKTMRQLNVCHYTYGGFQTFQLNDFGVIQKKNNGILIEDSCHFCLNLNCGYVLFHTQENRISIISHDSFSLVRSMNIHSPRKGVYICSHGFLYVLSERRSIVTVVNINTMSIVQEVCTAKSREAINSPSSILLSNDGRHLIISNRGENSIVSFNIDLKSGFLSEFMVLYSGNGKCPRDISISFDDRILAVAFKESNYIELFEIGFDFSCLSSITRITSYAPIGISFLDL